MGHIACQMFQSFDIVIFQENLPCHLINPCNVSSNKIDDKEPRKVEKISLINQRMNKTVFP